MLSESTIDSESTISSVAVRNNARALQSRLNRAPKETDDPKLKIRCLHHKYEAMKRIAREEKSKRIRAEKYASNLENQLKATNLQY